MHIAKTPRPRPRDYDSDNPEHVERELSRITDVLGLATDENVAIAGNALAGLELVGSGRDHAIAHLVDALASAAHVIETLRAEIAELKPAVDLVERMTSEEWTSEHVISGAELLDAIESTGWTVADIERAWWRGKIVSYSCGFAEGVAELAEAASC